jgi:hypothetical protein
MYFLGFRGVTSSYIGMATPLGIYGHLEYLHTVCTVYIHFCTAHEHLCTIYSFISNAIKMQEAYICSFWYGSFR